MPGPVGNLNSVRNGTSMRLPLGLLPPALRRQQQAVRRYRRELEALVTAAKGNVSATDAHHIDAAATAEVHAAVCRWLLRTRLSSMSTADVARCSEQVVKAKAARNKAVEALRLDAPPPSPWACLETTASKGTDDVDDQ